jgi:hypothetical protein
LLPCQTLYGRLEDNARIIFVRKKINYFVLAWDLNCGRRGRMGEIIFVL